MTNARETAAHRDSKGSDPRRSDQQAALDSNYGRIGISAVAAAALSWDKRPAPPEPRPWRRDDATD